MAELQQDIERCGNLLATAKMSAAGSRQRITALQSLDEAINRPSRGGAAATNQLLPRFAEQYLEHHVDASPAVRRLVAIFAERCLRHDTSRWLPLALAPLVAMCNDPSPIVAKTITQVVATVLPLVLRSFAGEARSWTDLHQSAWLAWLRLKSAMIRGIESPCESVRSVALKLMEVIIITNTCNGSGRTTVPLTVAGATGGTVVRTRPEPFAQSDVPYGHPSMDVAALTHEADELLQQLIDRVQPSAERHLTETNQSVVIACLAGLARQRVTYIDRIVPVLLRLQDASTSAYPASQLRRINFVLKTQLVSFLKLRAAEEYWPTITETLSALGFGDEANAAKMPSRVTTRAATGRDKRTRPDGTTTADVTKRIRPDGTTDTSSTSNGDASSIAASGAPSMTSSLAHLPAGQAPSSEAAAMPMMDPTDPAFNYLLERFSALPPGLIAELVIRSMNNFNVPLPPSTPARGALPTFSPLFVQFLASLSTRSSAAAATSSSATTPHAVPPPTTASSSAASLVAEGLVTSLDNVQAQAQSTATDASSTVVATSTAVPSSQSSTSLTTTSSDPNGVVSRSKAPSHTPLLTRQMCVSLARSAFARILSVDTEKAVTSAGQSSLRASLLSKLVTTQFDDDDAQHPADHQALLMYILADFQERYEIAVRWLYALLAVDTRRAKATASHTNGIKHENGTLITAAATAGQYDNYTSMLTSILSGLEQALDPSDSLFTAFLIDLPYIPPCVYDTLHRYVQQNDTRLLGLSSLRDLVLDRFPARNRALSMLLDYSHDMQRELRQGSVRLIANQLYVDASLRDDIEAYAKVSLHRILADDILYGMDEIAPPPPLDHNAVVESCKAIVAAEMEAEAAAAAATNGHDDAAMAKENDDTHTTGKTSDSDDATAAAAGTSEKKATTTNEVTRLLEEKKKEAKEKERREALIQVQLNDHLAKEKEYKDRQKKRSEQITRHLTLFFALTARRPELLDTLFMTYVSAPQYQRQCIHEQLPELVRTLGMNNEALLTAMKGCVRGSEPCVLHILNILTKTELASMQLMEVVHFLYSSRQDARFVIPILPGLSKDATRNLLPKLIMLPSNHLKIALLRLLRAAPLAFAPGELLVHLHFLDSPSLHQTRQGTTVAAPALPGAMVDVKKVIEATQICMRERDLYKQEVLAAVLQQLVDATPVPKLFMRTLIHTLTLFPGLMSFAMNLLSRLVVRRVWEDQVLWEGFYRCAKMAAPHSFPVLLQLPAPRLQEVFKAVPELRSLLASHAASSPATIPHSLLSLLLPHAA